MGLDSGVAGRYATALYELASEENMVDAISAELSNFSSAIDASPELSQLVHSPVISAENKLLGLNAILPKLGLSQGTGNFLKVLARNNRLGIINSVIAAFNANAAEERNEVTAEVTSAHPMNDAQTQALQAALKKKFNKEVQMNLHVDQDLLGGVVIRVGSQMIDNSLKTKLKTLEISMKEVG